MDTIEVLLDQIKKKKKHLYQISDKCVYVYKYISHGLRNNWGDFAEIFRVSMYIETTRMRPLVLIYFKRADRIQIY